jgi:hypothetical protein
MKIKMRIKAIKLKVNSTWNSCWWGKLKNKWKM